jgi:signal transduction histidine kinase
MEYLNYLYLSTLKVVKVFLKSIKRIISVFLPQRRERITKQQRTLEVLSSLSYRTGELKGYLQLVANSVSELLDLDWAVVTLCREGAERVLASSIDMGYDENYRADLHGTLTETVIRNGKCLYVEDASIDKSYGEPPEGYFAYLGAPLRIPTGEIIGTICSFHRQPRKFTTDEMRLVEIFAERAATAIDNYNLYQAQQEINLSLHSEIKERQEAEQALQQEQQRTIKAMERLSEIGELAATIIHEVRNPLTTVLMGLNFLNRMELPDSARKRLTLALDEAERLKRLLNEILLYAKHEVIQPRSIDMNKLALELIENISNTQVAIGKKIVFEALPEPLIILGDKDKLTQVLINLLQNACEAVPEGEKISVSFSSLIGSRQICLQVQNKGTPIPDDLLPNLTKPFMTTKPAGSGLGLAIVKKIVEAHGGKLDIESSAIAGTIVSVLLPQAMS